MGPFSEFAPLGRFAVRDMGRLLLSGSSRPLHPRTSPELPPSLPPRLKRRSDVAAQARTAILAIFKQWFYISEFSMKISLYLHRTEFFPRDGSLVTCILM